MDPPVETYFTVYQFNVTNPGAVLAGGKPRLVEVGPYVYRSKVIQDRVEWTPDFQQVSRCTDMSKKACFNVARDSRNLGQSFKGRLYRVVQLNFTPEVEVFHMLFYRSLSIVSTGSD